MTLALPVGHLVAYFAWHTQWYIRYRRFCLLDDGMMSSGGLDFSAPFSSLFTHPFLQTDGGFAILLACVLYPVFVVVERRAGHVKFLALLVTLWLTSVAAHLFQVAVSERIGGNYMCGIAPIAIGFLAFFGTAYPNLRLRWSRTVSLSSFFLWGGLQGSELIDIVALT